MDSSRWIGGFRADLQGDGLYQTPSIGLEDFM